LFERRLPHRFPWFIPGGNGLVGVALKFEVSFWELSRGQLVSDEQFGETGRKDPHNFR
jgi:hypothetical protein